MKYIFFICMVLALPAAAQDVGSVTRDGTWNFKWDNLKECAERCALQAGTDEYLTILQCRMMHAVREATLAKTSNIKGIPNGDPTCKGTK